MPHLCAQCNQECSSSECYRCLDCGLLFCCKEHSVMHASSVTEGRPLAARRSTPSTTVRMGDVASAGTAAEFSYIWPSQLIVAGGWVALSRRTVGDGGFAYLVYTHQPDAATGTWLPYSLERLDAKDVDKLLTYQGTYAAEADIVSSLSDEVVWDIERAIRAAVQRLDDGNVHNILRTPTLDAESWMSLVASVRDELSKIPVTDNNRPALRRISKLIDGPTAVPIILAPGARAVTHLPTPNALIRSVQDNHADMISYNVQQHPEWLNAVVDPRTGDTLLHVALRAASTNVIEYLSGEGANWDAKNKNNETPRSLYKSDRIRDVFSRREADRVAAVIPQAK